LPDGHHRKLEPYKIIFENALVIRDGVRSRHVMRAARAALTAAGKHS